MTVLALMSRRGWARLSGLCAGVAGAAFMGLSAGAHADADGPTLALADLWSAYDAMAAYENSYGLFADALFFSHLPEIPFAPLSALLADPALGATVSDELSMLAAEGTTITGQLAGLEPKIEDSSAIAAIDGKELPVIVDMLDFQQQINNSVESFPAISAQMETDPLLVYELNALYVAETDLDTWALNLGYSLGSPAGTTADNVQMLFNGLAMAYDLHSAVDISAILADLASVGL
ncbi:hypothetical protein [Mycobacterium sp.]|uniref:hypothetical protein n=1 Tax=Mycobacterium sp. TaxID=1785 RepID=UPI00127C80C0|nr:hypothetical protein [Mycobacterium sp.]KAA8959865.1 MAG: hypothetical protein F6Q13_14240 [Mycobacterium sp.]